MDYEIEIPCPLCEMGTIEASPLYASAFDGAYIWEASCDNAECKGYGEVEILGDTSLIFPLEEWVEDINGAS